MGIILLEMCNKFSTGHERGMVLRKLKKERVLPAGPMLESETQLILAMTEKDPAKRLSITELQESKAYREWLSQCQLDTSKEDEE